LTLLENNYLNIKMNVVKVKIKTIAFQEGNSFIVYCPALDISGYGDSVQDAQESFETSLEIYLEFATENGTLSEDLLNHGWTLSRYPVTLYSPPAIDDSNESIKKIVGAHSYQVLEESIALPA